MAANNSQTGKAETLNLPQHPSQDNPSADQQQKQDSANPQTYSREQIEQNVPADPDPDDPASG